MSSSRRSLAPGFGLAVLLVTAIVQISNEQPRAQCSPNPIVCENANPGAPASEWDISSAGDDTIQGFATEHQRQQRRNRSFQSRHHGRDASTSTSIVSATTAAWARGRWRHAHRRRRPQPAELPDQRIDRADRLRQLGETALVDGAHDGGRPGVYVAKLTRHRHGRRQSHRVRRSRRSGARRHPVPDLGHDLAGLQHLRRQQPLRRRAGRQSRPRLQGELQPSVHDARHERRGLRLQRRVPDGPVARSQRLRRQLLHRRRHRSHRRHRAAASTRSFLSVGHDEYWSGRSAPTSKRRAPPASTSRSSAATKCSGRRGGRTSIDGTNTPCRTLVCYKETHANAKIDPRIRRRGPARGAIRGSARRRTAAGRRTR